MFSKAILVKIIAIHSLFAQETKEESDCRYSNKYY